MAKNKFQLRSCAGGPFKMMGASPVKMAITLGGTGANYTNKDNKSGGDLSGGVGLQFGNFNLGAKATTSNTGKKASITGGLNLEPYKARFASDYKGTSYTRVSGEYDTKGSGKGRLDFGVSRPGKSGCVGGMCYGAPVTGYNFSAFGETGSEGNKAGISANYGMLSGEAARNFTTGKNEYKFGLNIPMVRSKRSLKKKNNR